jgi:hypothetical protein
MSARPAIRTFSSMTITTTRTSDLTASGVSVTTRRLSFVACALWLGVAASTAKWWEATDDWGLWYGIYSLLLGSAAALTAATAVSANWRGSTERMETLGVVLTGVAVCTTVIAWALPFWMLSIAVGYSVFAIEFPRQRRRLGLLAFAQVAGVAVLLAGNAARLGRSDEWGDHPVAGSASVATTALLTVAALILLARSPRRPA